MRLLKLSSLVASFLLLFVASPQLAAAHVLKQDNGISGVLHIVPDDNPKADELTELDMSFGDTQRAFSMQHCDCQVVVNGNAKSTLTTHLKPALAGAIWNGKASLTFPEAGVYTVTIIGKSMDASFPAFRLDYLVRVVGTSTGNQPNNSFEVGAISAASLVLLMMVSSTAVKLGGRYQSKK